MVVVKFPATVGTGTIRPGFLCFTVELASARGGTKPSVGIEGIKLISAVSTNRVIGGSSTAFRLNTVARTIPLLLAVCLKRHPAGGAYLFISLWTVFHTIPVGTFLAAEPGVFSAEQVRCKLVSAFFAYHFYPFNGAFLRISILEVLISVLGHGLGVVAGFTQRLPVSFIPKEMLVAAMRNDVVDHCGGDELALRLTLHAERVRFEERSASFLPASSVTFFFC